MRRELDQVRMERDILKNGPYGLPCPLCIETSGGTIRPTRGQWPSASWRYQPRQKNLAQGDLRTHLWRHLRVTPFRKLIQSESPVLRFYF